MEEEKTDVEDPDVGWIAGDPRRTAEQWLGRSWEDDSYSYLKFQWGWALAGIFAIERLPADHPAHAEGWRRYSYWARRRAACAERIKRHDRRRLGAGERHWSDDLDHSWGWEEIICEQGEIMILRPNKRKLGGEEGGEGAGDLERAR